MGKNQWVSPYGDNKWGVHGEGNERYTKVFDTQEEAVKYAKEIATNQKSELIIQDENGRILSKDGYGYGDSPKK